MAKKGSKQGSRNSRTRETEEDRELWARLDELEREEEEYLAKEREERERESASTVRNEEREIVEGGVKPASRTKISEERERVAVEVKATSKHSAVAAGPLKITIKHTPSKDTAAPTRVKMVCIYMYTCIKLELLPKLYLC